MYKIPPGGRGVYSQLKAYKQRGVIPYFFSLYHHLMVFPEIMILMAILHVSGV